jgi:YD repeat-containing protein
MAYDGYGRLKTRHVPEQNVATATIYTYNSDDTVHTITDARGASVSYGYNARHLVTSKNYNAPLASRRQRTQHSATTQRETEPQ